MTQTGFEGISTNCSILKHLNNYLNFADRLRLSQCSRRLRNYFESHIWPEKFESLQIYENDDILVVCNETGTNCLNLSSEEFKEFLNVYARDVKRLSDERNNVQDLEKFDCLLKLNLGKRAIERHLLDLVADNCPNLQELCVYITTSGPLDTEEILHLDALLPMKSLKHLCVETDVNVKMHLRQFREFIAETKLESFVLGAAIVLEEPDATWKETLLFANELRQLDIIVANTNPNKLSRNFVGCLNNFENLQSLCLEMRSPLVMDSSSLRIICQICTKLQRLFISSTTVETQEFHIPPMLEEISLHGCLGLTCVNLKQILSAELITKFSSQHTQYKGNSTDLHLPPNLETLKCDDWAACHLKYAFNANDNLKFLKWHKSLADDNDIATDGRLVACGNLTEIVWRGGSIPIENLLQLTKLQRLTIALPLSDCIALLKHSSLQEFIITKSWCDIDRSDIPLEGVTTKLRMLHITLATMTVAIDYWLILLQKNITLSLICAYEPKDLRTKDEFLKQIIENANFPRDLRTLDIWGYKIDILKLKQQFKDTMDKLRHDTKHLSHLYTSNMHRLVLSRD